MVATFEPLITDRCLLYRGRLQCFSATYVSAIWGKGGWMFIEVAALHSDYLRQVSLYGVSVRHY